MKKSRNSDKLFPLYKHPTDALPAPNGADFGVWGYCPQQAFFASVLTLALLAGLCFVAQHFPWIPYYSCFSIHLHKHRAIIFL